MLRKFLLIALFGMLYIMFKRLIARSTSSAKTVNKAEKIVCCSQCGLYVPENESQINGALVICNHPDCSSVEK